jgi:uncharacterized protein YbjT (DUF2867 family)
MAARRSNKLILVTGATGHQGGAVLQVLHEKGYPVRASTRHPDSPKAHALVGHGTEIVRGDLDDMPSLVRAMDGVYGVFSVQTPMEEGVEAEIRQGINLADAAKRSRVSHFVYSSVSSADRRTGIPHFESKFRIEEHVRATGTPYTIFRPVFFMENWLGMRDTIEQGVLAMPLDPETRLQMIAVRDIGVFTAMAFEKPGHWQGRAVDIAGDELSMREIADSLGRLSGRVVAYSQIPWDRFEQTAGREMTVMYRWFQDVGYSVDLAALRQENSNLTNFERWLQTNWRSQTQAA